MKKKKNNVEGLFNCIRLCHPITDIFTRRYAYLDSENYLADRIFERKNIRVKFYKEEFRKGSWVIVRCIIRKKDEEEFLETMEELSRNAMLVANGNEYVETCRQFISAFRKSLYDIPDNLDKFIKGES